MKAYKLFKKRKDGTLGSLFINTKAILPLNEWIEAKPYRKKGFAFRPGWHSTLKPIAPHLKTETKTQKRVWAEVEVEDNTFFERPECQGGKWVLSQKLKIIKEL